MTKLNMLPVILPHREVPIYISGISQDFLYPLIGELKSQDDYFRFQHETSAVIDSIKEEEIRRFYSNSNFPEYNPSHQFIHENRKDNVRIRGVHSRVYALALGSIEDSFLPSIGAGIEFLLEYMYYLNQIFDSKSNPNPCKNSVAGAHSLDMAYRLITGSSQTGSLNPLFNKIVNGFLYGELFDCNHNTWQKLRESSLEQKINSCDKRTYYIDALFFQLIAEIADTFAKSQGREVNPKKRDALSAYAHYYGMGLQVVNDIADFVPPSLNRGTSEKTPDDSYADIKNGKMTYPIIMMLELANQDDRKKIISALEGNLQNEQYEDLTKIFVNSGAYGKCKALARDYQRKALDMAREFPEPASFLLSRLSIMLASNRYYATFTQIKEIQK